MLPYFCLDWWSRKLFYISRRIEHLDLIKIKWSAQKLIFFFLFLSFHEFLLIFIILLFLFAKFFHMAAHKWIQFQITSFWFCRALNRSSTFLKLSLRLTQNILNILVHFFKLFLIKVFGKFLERKVLKALSFKFVLRGSQLAWWEDVNCLLAIVSNFCLRPKSSSNLSKSSILIDFIIKVDLVTLIELLCEVKIFLTPTWVFVKLSVWSVIYYHRSLSSRSWWDDWRFSL